jgi:hypothetical protein
MEKIPRSAEEGTEELLGANAMLNRNVTKSLQAWQQSTWKLPFCQTGKPLKNVYYKISFSSFDNQNFAVGLLSRNAFEKIADARLAEEVNRKFYAAGGNNKANEDLEFGGGDSFTQRIFAALKNVDKRTNNNNSTNSSSSTTTLLTGNDSSLMATIEDKSASQLNLSLQDLISSIEHSQQQLEQQDEEGGRGTRFAHATMFSQENHDVISSSTTTVNFSSILSSSSSTNNNMTDETTTTTASISDSYESTNKPALSIQDRKLQMEQEEQRRQQEIQQLKQEIQDLSDQVTNESQKEDLISQKVAALEKEVKLFYFNLFFYF